MNKQELIADIKSRIELYWVMVEGFKRSKEPHGVMDTGADLQSLYMFLKELDKLDDDKETAMRKSQPTAK